VSARPWLPFAAAALLVAVVGALLPPTGFYCMDAGPKYLQTRAILESSELPRAIPYPGLALDPDGLYLPDSMQRAGSGVVSIFPVLLPLLAAPGLALGGPRWLLLVPFLGAVVAAWLAGRLALRLAGPREARLVTTVSLLATPLAFYALTFWEHAPGAALVLGALLAIVRAIDGEGGPGTWALAGALLALAAGMRTEYVVMLPLVLAPLATGGGGRRWTSTLAAGAGAAGGLATVAALQRLVLGAWLPPHFAHNAALGKLPVHPAGDWLALLGKFLAPDVWSGAAVALWAAALIAALLPASRQRKTTRVLTVLAAVGVLVAAVAPSLLRWLGGMRPTMAFPHYAVSVTWLVLAALPVAIAGPPPVRRAAARQVLGAAALWLIAASALLWPLNDDTMQWGARQWLAAILIAVVLMLTAPPAAGGWGRVRRAVIAAAVAAGIGVNLLGFALLHHATRGNEALVRRLLAATRPGAVIVTDTPFLPEYAAMAWQERKILYCRDGAAFAALLDRIAAGGPDEWFIAYVEHAPNRRHAFTAGEEIRAADGTRFVRTAADAGLTGGRELHVMRFRRAP
jgi:hypothetical protein